MSVFEIGDKVFSPSWECRNDFTDMVLMVVETYDDHVTVSNENGRVFRANPSSLKFIPQLEVGDIGIMHKPVHDIGKPHWDRSMDRWDGERVTVSVADPISDRRMRIGIKGSIFFFNPAWFEPIETVETLSFDMEIEDFLG